MILFGSAAESVLTPTDFARSANLAGFIRGMLQTLDLSKAREPICCWIACPESGLLESQVCDVFWRRGLWELQEYRQVHQSLGARPRHVPQFDGAWSQATSALPPLVVDVLPCLGLSKLLEALEGSIVGA